MRMRKKKNLPARLERVSGYIIAFPAENRGRWHEFSGGRPIHLEIGCGKGRFICETAKENPDVFFIAFEKISNVLITALERAAAEELDNLRFINRDAAILPEYFDKNEVSRIYLNFSDPWPAARHTKRRLTSEGFLKIYRSILKPEGNIYFKTDNSALFEFSITEFERCGWLLSEVTRDLHGDGLDGGVMTEYEERFCSMGIPIKRLVARPTAEEVGQ